MSDELWEDVLLNGRKHISIDSLKAEIERLILTQFGFSKAFNVTGRARKQERIFTAQRLVTNLRNFIHIRLYTHFSINCFKALDFNP